MTHADWISRRELMDLTGWSERTIFRLQAKGELKTRITPKIAANGRPSIEYDAGSLPAEFQARRLQQKITSAPLVLVKHSSTAVATLPAPGSDQIVRAIATLDAEARAQAEQRLQIIAPMIDFVNKTNGHKPLFTTGGREITSLSGIVRHLATLGYSERTLWNWWNQYKAGGPGALADKPRSDRNISRFFKEHKDAAAFASNKFLNERLSVRLVYEALLREWRRLRLNEEDAPPSYETVRVFINGLSPLITAVARQGERAYNEDFAPYLVRDIGKVRVNAYWISDHVIHDVWVRNYDAETGGVVFPELKLNEAFRPWLTCIVDMRSRRVVGHVWCVNPSSNSISSALRYGLRSYGRPEVFYVDNGKDYLKLGKGHAAPRLSDDAQGVLFRLGIKSQHCLPKHPQSKQIESFFRTLHQRFDVLWGDCYAGNSPKNRPEACDEVLRVHKKLLASGGEMEQSPLPPAGEFIQAAANWLHVFNTTFQHSGRGMNGRTAQQIYDGELPPHKRRPVNPADVAQLFWDRQERVVSEGGCVQLFNARYQPADAESAAALMLEIKRTVLVACDPLSVGEAIALTHEGKFLGHLRAQELLVHGETSAEEIRQSMRARRSIFKAVKQYAGALEKHRRLAGDVSELEALTRRAAAAGAAKANANILALPVPRAVGDAPQQRMHADDIADSFLEE